MSEWKEFYDFHANQVDDATRAEIHARAEAEIGQSMDPDDASDTFYDAWIRQYVAVGDEIAEALNDGLDEIAEDIEEWRNTANEWEEDTNVVIRTIADALGDADLTVYWDSVMSEVSAIAARAQVAAWSGSDVDSGKNWTLTEAAQHFGEAARLLEVLAQNWNEYHERTQEGAGLAIDATVVTIKILSNRIAPGSGGFVAEFVKWANGV